MERTTATSGKGEIARQSWLALAALCLAACQSATGAATGGGSFGGAVVADEPRAALVARDILEQGGSAADAATALGFALAATLPSRVGLGGGGVCLARDGNTPGDWGIPLGINTGRERKPIPKTEAFVFIPEPLPGKPEIALPALARGLSVIHARLGKLRWEQLVVPAENLARFGVPTSRALAHDVVAAKIDLRGRDGRPLREGVPIFLPELSQALGLVRANGAGILHSGALAEAFAAGIGVDPASLRAGVPAAVPALAGESGNDKAYFPPSEGGAYAAALFREASGERRGRSGDGAARTAAVGAAATRLAARFPPVEGEAATTSFTVVDWRGASVACSLTLGGLFGSQLIVPGTGVIAGVPVRQGSATARALATMIVANDNSNQFIAAFAAGGDATAPQALVQVALATLSAERPLQQAQMDFRAGSGRNLGETQERPASAIGGAEGPGFVNAIVCRDGLPREPRSCSAQHDPRGFGISVTAEPKR